MLAFRLSIRSIPRSPAIQRLAHWNNSLPRKLSPILITGCGLSISAISLARIRARVAHCYARPPVDDPWLLVPEVHIDNQTSAFLRALSSPLALCIYILSTFRKLVRCVSLFLRFVPLSLVYPLTCRVERLDRLWWRIFLFAVQSSGPTFLKLGQWASTRRDIFSKQFCDKLSILHTKTRNKRLFRDKEAIIDEVFGRGFYKKHRKTVFKTIEPYSIGSGCIAQVYKMTVDIPELERATGRKIPELEGRHYQEVAIKVADRNVERKIELDLSILRSLASIAQRIVPSVSLMDPTGALEQFEMVLRRQVDLRNEARALIKFSENFDHSKSGIRFPVVVGYSKNILAETFEEGIYINRLVAEEQDPELKTRQAPAVRRRIALLGARALLKMIFVDNFVHGDLHPGNILIRFNDNVDTLPGVHMAPQSENIIKRTYHLVRSALGWRSRPRVRFTDSPFMQDEPTLVLLDTGIAISETPEKLANLKALFRAIVEKKGYDAGHMLLTHSPKQNCTDPDRFCKQVEVLVNKAMSERSLRKLNISGLLSEMFSIVAEHHVSLDSSFTTVILSVMVLEGFGRSLDPDLDLFQCARPYLLNVMF